MPRKIAILGCGAVGKAVLHYLPKFLKCSYKDVIVLDKYKSEADFPSVQACIAKGAKFIHYEVTSSNVRDLLDKVLKLSTGDLMIDVTTRTPTMLMFAECRKRGIHFINTDINRASEGSLDHSGNQESFADTLYMYHVALDEMDHKTKHYKHARMTTLNESGMNPGLITTFVKVGLCDIARFVIKQCPRKTYCGQLRTLLRAKDYRGLCQALDVQVIHCSEIDTQVPDASRVKDFKKKNILVNTWSVNGMVEEATEPCGISLGTHENSLPMRKADFTSDVVPHVGILHKPGMKTWFRSYLPVGYNEDGSVKFEEIKGCALPHGETFSLQRLLTTDGYAPTMHYVYRMNPLTRSQIHGKTNEELTKWTWERKNWKVMNMHDDRLKGTDNVGATFLLGRDPITGDKKPWGWWAGSILDDNYTRDVLKDAYFSPTVIPVMAGILSGAAWVLQNPNEGMVYPEAMSASFIMKKAKKYLGHWYSGQITGCKIRGTRISQLMVTESTRKTKITKDDAY